jgi:hypothetical protein
VRWSRKKEESFAFFNESINKYLLNFWKRDHSYKKQHFFGKFLPTPLPPSLMCHFEILVQNTEKTLFENFGTLLHLCQLFLLDLHPARFFLIFKLTLKVKALTLLISKGSGNVIAIQANGFDPVTVRSS